MMIIANITGGLGNQMFQYAAARTVARRLQTVLKLDTSFLRNYKGERVTQRKYFLDQFNISTEIATNREILSYTVPRFNNPFTYHIAKKLFIEKRIVRQDKFEFTSLLNECVDNSYIDGNWQSEKYFLNAADIIRKELCIKPDLVLRFSNTPLFEHIVKSNSLSVHVRRGDYLRFNQEFNLLNKSYYIRALEWMQKQSQNTHLFFFSDDIEWCKRTFYEKEAYFVEGNTPVEDLFYMSHCRNNIIANSSFSWWAAWLNTNPTKKIVAPREWFIDSAISTADLFPNSWKIL